MALCTNYEGLSHFEKVALIGQIVHALQSDNEIFEGVNTLIQLAQLKGIFDKVEILPKHDPIGDKIKEEDNNID